MTIAAGQVASAADVLAAIAAVASGSGQPYTIGGFAPGVMTNGQLLLLHEFPIAVTFPANFGASISGGSSKAGTNVNATASTALTIDKCPAGSDPTNAGNFVNVGSIVISASSHTGTFSSSGGGTVACAAGDFLRLLGPATADATAANFFATLVGNR